MSSFYEFDKNALNDSRSFTLNIVKNIVPKNGKAIVGTSMSERGFTGRTLTSPDLISAASGKYLFKNSVYENVYRANLVKENYTGLLTTMLEGQLTPEGQETEAFAAKMLVQSGIGREGSDRGLLRGVSTALNSTYNNSETVTAYSVGENSVPHVYQDYNSSSGVVSTVKYVDVALVSRLTDQQKSFYSARGELLARNLNISKGDINILKNGFTFDIRDNNLMAEYDVTNSRLFTSVDQIERRINESLIRASSETAYISANLIECLMALASTSYGPPLRIDGYNGGFGTFRQDGTTGARPRSSGAQGNNITDHAFGRAFDIMGLYENVTDQVERKYLKKITKINSKQGYQHQLDVLLRKLNAMPQHLVPDYMAVSAKYIEEEYDTMDPQKTSVIGVKYPNLKHLKIKRDSSPTHDNHIHISFAATRGGIYAGPNGQLATFASAPTSSAPAGLPGTADRAERVVSINEYTKDYTGNTASVDPTIIYNALVEYGLFTPELAACFVALAWRESRRMVYVVQRVYAAFGLWQVSTVPKDGGKGEAYLSFPQKDNIIYWKLALPDKANENLSDSQITSLINERAPKDGTVRIDLFDRRCWNIANQIDFVRSKMGFKGRKQPVDGLTERVMAWGDGYWEKGWITHVKFSDASEIYRKMTRKNRR